MDERKLLLGGVLAAVAYGIWSVTNDATKLQFGDLKKQSIKFNIIQIPPTVDVYFLLPFTNPTNKNYPFRNIKAALMYGTTNLANVEYNGDTSQAFTLGAGKSGYIPIKSTINLLEVGGSIATMIKNGTWLNEARLKGVIYADINIPLNQKIF
jgi:hypothetical protein